MAKAKAGEDMRDYLKRRTDLAVMYAEDGAYHTAAKVLLELAGEIHAHAHEIDRLLIVAVQGSNSDGS